MGKPLLLLLLVLGVDGRLVRVAERRQPRPAGRRDAPARDRAGAARGHDRPRRRDLSGRGRRAGRQARHHDRRGRPQRRRARRSRPAPQRDHGARRRRLHPQHVGAQFSRERVLLGRRRPLPRVLPHRLECAGLRHLHRGRGARRHRPQLRLGRGRRCVLHRRVQAVPGDHRERRRRALGRGLLRDELDRRRDPGLDLARQRRRHRPQHVRKRGAAAGGGDDDRPQRRHAQRPGAGAAAHGARGVRRRSASPSRAARGTSSAATA